MKKIILVIATLVTGMSVAAPEPKFQGLRFECVKWVYGGYPGVEATGYVDSVGQGTGLFLIELNNQKQEIVGKVQLGRGLWSRYVLTAHYQQGTTSNLFFRAEDYFDPNRGDSFEAQLLYPGVHALDSRLLCHDA